MNTEARLEQRKKRILAELQLYFDIVQGTIVQRMHTCGKPGCRCHRAVSQRHCSYQLTFAVDGKTRTVTIPKDKLAAVRKGLKQYRDFRKSVRQLLEINRCLIKRQPSLPMEGGR